MTKDIIKVIAMLAITAVCGCHGTVPFYVAFQIIGSFLFLINAVNQLLTLL